MWRCNDPSMFELLFCNVSLMVIEWYQLIGHVGGGDGALACCRNFVVEYLVLWC